MNTLIRVKDTRATASNSRQHVNRRFRLHQQTSAQLVHGERCLVLLPGVAVSSAESGQFSGQGAAQ